MKRMWEKLDSIFRESANPLLLNVAMKKVTSKYIVHAQQNELLFSLKQLSQLAGTRFSPTVAQEIRELLEVRQVYVGEYLAKRSRDDEEYDHLYFVPRSYLQFAIKVLRQSRFRK